MPPSWSEHQRVRRAHGKWEGSRSRRSATRATAPLNGRRGPTRPSTLWLGRAAFDAVMQCWLWLLGWRDADPSLCSGLLVAMPRELAQIAWWVGCTFKSSPPPPPSRWR